MSMMRTLPIPVRPDHIYVEWAGNGRCFFCDAPYEEHDRQSAALLYGEVPAWAKRRER